jgi:hypothetical protein
VTGIALALVALLFAAVPAVLFGINLRLYRVPPAAGLRPQALSILIPARNEEGTIGAAIEAALASSRTDFEVLVLDDGSEDRTAAVVQAIAERDARVRLVKGAPLPAGWCGKQHACAALAREARHPLLAFIDADVRLRSGGLDRAAAFLAQARADLASGIPRQETGSLMERLVIPLMHFLLLGFLPVARMRAVRHRAYGAGCGQLFLARREAYEQAGGHGAIRASLHDGLTLPRAFRDAGLVTDLFDATEVATCRMFGGAAALWRGLARNAGEGLAAPAMIVPASAILLAGQVLPFLLLAAWPLVEPLAAGLAALAAALALYPRLAGRRRFHQPLSGALLHPLGIAVLVAIQWYAFLCSLSGRPSLWRGRVYPPAGGNRRSG